jgi:hypothetical protein
MMARFMMTVKPIGDVDPGDGSRRTRMLDMRAPAAERP